MVKTFAVLGLLSLVLGLSTAQSTAQPPRRTIMVVDFADQVGKWPDIREAVTVRLIAKLREDPLFRVLSRDQVQGALLKVQAETSGFLNWEDAQKAGEILKADYIIMGEVTAFDQENQSGCLPVVGCANTTTATVALHGKVLDLSTGQFVSEPKAEVKKQQGGASVSVGADLGTVTFENFDSQLVGKATLEAVEKFVNEAKSHLK